MTPDTLETLIISADRRAGLPPKLAGDLVQRAAVRANRRRNQQRVAWAAAATIVLAATGYATIGGSGKRKAPDAPPLIAQERANKAEVARLRREIAALRAEADVRARVFAQFLRDERRNLHAAEVRRILAEDDPLAIIAVELERAAQTIIHQADRLAHEHNRPDEARRLYQRTINLFPATTAARQADARLKSVRPSTGDHRS